MKIKITHWYKIMFILLFIPIISSCQSSSTILSKGTALTQSVTHTGFKILGLDNFYVFEASQFSAYVAGADIVPVLLADRKDISQLSALTIPDTLPPGLSRVLVISYYKDDHEVVRSIGAVFDNHTSQPYTVNMTNSSIVSAYVFSKMMSIAALLKGKSLAPYFRPEVAQPIITDTLSRVGNRPDLVDADRLVKAMIQAVHNIRCRTEGKATCEKVDVIDTDINSISGTDFQQIFTDDHLNPIAIPAIDSKTIQSILADTSLPFNRKNETEPLPNLPYIPAEDKLPEITALSHAHIKPGETLTIYGKNFRSTCPGDNNPPLIKFGMTQKTFPISYQDTQIKVTVPPDAASGPVKVFVPCNGGRDSSVILIVADKLTTPAELVQVAKPLPIPVPTPTAKEINTGTLTLTSLTPLFITRDRFIKYHCPITIRGTGFQPLTSVELRNSKPEGSYLKTRFIDPTTLTVEVPDLSTLEEKNDLLLRNPGGQTVSLKAALGQTLRIVNDVALSLTELVPTSLVSNKPQYLALRGNGLHRVTSVKLGEAVEAPVQSRSDAFGCNPAEIRLDLWRDPTKRLIPGTYNVALCEGSACKTMPDITLLVTAPQGNKIEDISPTRFVANHPAQSVTIYGKELAGLKAFVNGIELSMQFLWGDKASEGNYTNVAAILPELPPGKYSLTIKKANGQTQSYPIEMLGEPVIDKMLLQNTLDEPAHFKLQLTGGNLDANLNGIQNYFVAVRQVDPFSQKGQTRYLVPGTADARSSTSVQLTFDKPQLKPDEQNYDLGYGDVPQFLGKDSLPPLVTQLQRVDNFSIKIKGVNVKQMLNQTGTYRAVFYGSLSTSSGDLETNPQIMDVPAEADAIQVRFTEPLPPGKQILRLIWDHRESIHEWSQAGLEAVDDFYPNIITKTLEIPGPTQGWADTGLKLYPGDRVTLLVKDTITCGSGCGPYGPSGYSGGWSDPAMLVPNLPLFSLVGQFNNEAPFVMATQKTVSISQEMFLKLGINDFYSPDNGGKFTITANILPGAARLEAEQKARSACQSTGNQGCIAPDLIIQNRVNGRIAVTPIVGLNEHTRVQVLERQGNISMYRYDFGDGSPPQESSSPDVFHIYRQAGRYPITVELRGEGGNRTITAYVTVR